MHVSVKMLDLVDPALFLQTTVSGQIGSQSTRVGVGIITHLIRDNCGQQLVRCRHVRDLSQGRTVPIAAGRRIGGLPIQDYTCARWQQWGPTSACLAGLAQGPGMAFLNSG